MSQKKYDYLEPTELVPYTPLYDFKEIKRPNKVMIKFIKPKENEPNEHPHVKGIP